MRYKSIEFFYNLPVLYKFFNRRRENLFTVEVEWWEGINDASVGRFVTQLPLVNGQTGSFVLVDISTSYGKQSLGLTFSLLMINGVKAIKDCNFREFVENYGDMVIQYINGKEMIHHA